MSHSQKRIALYLTTFALLTACALISTLQDQTASATAKLIKNYCLTLSYTKRMEMRKLINSKSNGHTIQIYCQQEKIPWPNDAQ